MLYQKQPLQYLLQLLFMILPLGGCAISYAPGYETLAEQHDVQYIKATPMRMFGGAPWSYDLPDKRQVEINVKETPTNTISLHLDQTELECRWNPSGPNIPETRFGCWSPGSDHVSFWLAPDQGCSGRDLGLSRGFTSPNCWKGTLQTEHARYHVAYSHAGALEITVPVVTWSDIDSGTTVQGVDSVLTGTLELHASHQRDPRDADMLMLHAVALHYWFHISH